MKENNIKIRKIKKIIVVACLMLLNIGLYCIMKYNTNYQQTVVYITKVDTTYTGKKEGNNQKSEAWYTQTILGLIQNGEYKGHKVEFKNQYSYSQVKNVMYKVGDQIFTYVKADPSGKILVTIRNQRRDYYLLGIVLIFLTLLGVAAGKRGILVIISILCNLYSLYFMLSHLSNDEFFHYGWIVLVVLFTIITLVFASGLNKKSFAAILSSLLSVGFMVLLYHFTIETSETVQYDMMPYIFAPLPLKAIYKVSVVFGCLGAVMDVAITITAAISELIATSAIISRKQLIQSMREIGYDIMGTMMNVLFFSYLSGGLCIYVLKIHSGYRMATILRFDFLFEFVRFLIGSIGIIITIPIAAIVGFFVFQRGGHWSK